MNISATSFRALSRASCIRIGPINAAQLLQFSRTSGLPLSGSKLATPLRHATARFSIPQQCGAQRRSIFSWLTSKGKKSDPKLSELSHRDWILIYHAGRKTVFVGCIKLATLYPFIATLFYVQPYINDSPVVASFPITQEYPYLAPILVTAMSAIPLWIFWFAAPYVTHMYVRLPNKAARGSRDATLNFIRNMGPTERVRMATMRGLGRPRLKEMAVGELKWVNKRLGCANVEWREKMANGVIKIRHFFIDEAGGTKFGDREVLRMVTEGIKRRTKDAEEAGRKELYKKIAQQ